MSAASEGENEGFLGETLFHFLGTGDDERLLDVFNSIVQRSSDSARKTRRLKRGRLPAYV
jgi:hypothetical protein